MGFLPLLLKFGPPLITPVLQLVESAFGPKSGPEKMRAAVQAVGPILEGLEKTGVLPEVPQAAELEKIVELVFQANRQVIEKAPGQGVSLVAPAGHRVVFLPVEAKLISIEFPTSGGE